MKKTGKVKIENLLTRTHTTLPYIRTHAENILGRKEHEGATED